MIQSLVSGMLVHIMLFSQIAKVRPNNQNAGELLIVRFLKLVAPVASLWL